MKSCIIAVTAYAGLSAAWMPSSDNSPLAHGNLPRQAPAFPGTSKIRGVNLGSQFIFEPWMAGSEWSAMGCGNTQSEFDCVSMLGQAAANTAWAKHWSTWTTQDDITQMQSYGLNAIRIPVGYWIREDLVYSDSEHFPQGGLQYLEQICGWASDAGLYIIIDLHGAPGAQVAGNSDTGQDAPSPGFYVDYQYERAYEFLEWMTNLTHTNSNYRNVGMLQILNEPEQGTNSDTDSMRQTYYPTAWSRIRAAESALNIPASNRLHIEMMNEKWGSGPPQQYLTDQVFAAYDDHRYLKYTNDNDINVPGPGQTPSAYLNLSCHDDRGGNAPTVVGEFSLSVADDVQSSSPLFAPPGDHVAWYARWFAAQIIAYEKQEGWLFWSWKADLDDWRWSYQAAVAAHAIPTNLDDAVNSDPCAGY